MYRYLNHLSQLVNAMHILCSSRISEVDFHDAKQNLLSFAENFEHLYGEVNTVYNVHMVRHLADCVKFIGPLWAYSNYCFEDHIGHLVSLHKGTTDVATQICEKYLLEKNLFQLFELSPIAGEFFQSIDSKKKYRVSHKIEGSHVIGNAKKFSLLTDDERSLIVTSLNISSEIQIDEYSKVLLNGKVLYEIAGCVSKRTYDAFILNTESKRFAEINAIFVVHEKLYFLVTEKFDLVHDQDNKCPFIYSLKNSDLPNQKVVKSKYIGPKFVFVKFNNNITCSKFPNMYERN